LTKRNSKVLIHNDEIAEGLTGDILELVACLQSYSDGNFDVNIKKHVGKK